MIESLKSFFDNLPVNHWSSFLIIGLSLIFIIYSVYFFFSKEGKDERGKKIISTASFISFIVTIVLLFILGTTLYDIVAYNQVSYYWMINLVLLIISGVEAFGIMILKKSN
ncbi:hypothetical protein JZO66_08695 [Enterococcus sp. DIV0242_7C1]|uniref:Uncharacterized protein n=1 Tax=Candidatus Enterococcus dunnyi TaxID=1834192 RepID=A0A200J8Y6_9ENTE|nr:MULTISPECIES: hypothetical protein [unclassified Enterococcus]MBO0470624.1 hypothetical protein [Enterococcus sp. DIV0242_7C1]MCA5012296.1 hypothetical protein [Enterococcus sp. S23]MCA5015547.1 hypothetical protein [Enterococcus sp. S22(2020)]OUZ33067.1 hypothetical protein A5889_001776 [Enterococcus sp. 9D6_DIV0238]